jgi:hypothetical protein
MPNNNNNPTAPKPKKRTFKIAKKKKDKFFKVTLTLSFKKHYESSNDIDREDLERYESITNNEFCERLQDWNQTDKAYGTDEKIMQHVKSNNALEFVEYIPDGEVVAAKWLDGFKIQFIVKYEDDLTKTAEELKDYLEMASLEDGEYESSGDNGWTVKTLKESMEYGLTDYRDNPIVVEEVSSGVLSGGGRRKKTRRNRKE